MRQWIFVVGEWIAFVALESGWLSFRPRDPKSGAARFDEPLLGTTDEEVAQEVRFHLERRGLL